MAARFVAVEPAKAGTLDVRGTTRSEPRLAFASLLETGAAKPGQALFGSRRRMRAQVRADGLIAVGAIAGSIHKVGALVQGLPACNGWTYWHVEEAGELKPD